MANTDYYDDVKSYFERKAEDYDLVDNQIFWQLSDKLLAEYIDKVITDHLDKDFCFFDAGAGTGRWSHYLLKKYPKSKGYLFDLSQDMLAQAKRKLEAGRLINRSVIKQFNLDNDFTKELARSFDFVFCFHNAIGFLNDARIFLQRLAFITNKDGVVVIMAPNMYHAIYFNLIQAKVDTAVSIYNTNRGKFINSMPEINFFTPTYISRILNEAGFDIIQLTGFPSIVYPGYQEALITGDSVETKSTFSKKSNFEKIFELEKQLLNHNDLSARGTNIVILGKKR